MTAPPLGWRSGNRYTLLENGEAYFPAVHAAVEAARREVLIETFIPVSYTHLTLPTNREV